MAKVLPKEQRAILAAHEGGAHDGPPYGAPRPDVCPECRKAKEQALLTIPPRRGDVDYAVKPAPADLDPKAPRRKAKVAGDVGPRAISDLLVLTDPKPKRRPKAAKPVIEVSADLVGHVIESVPGVFMVTTAEAVPAMPSVTREGWMLQAVEVMRRWFPEDHPVPEVRVSIGWPAGRGSSRFIGQCFYTTADHAPALFVAPSLSKTYDVLETLLHEAVHAAAGAGHGHKGLFVKLAKELGFVGPWRATPAGPELTQRLHALAESLGDFPHAKVAKSDSTRPSVQGTRMLKVECPTCGCILRMTNHWIETAGLPTCGCGEAMEQAA